MNSGLTRNADGIYAVTQQPVRDHVLWEIVDRGDARLDYSGRCGRFHQIDGSSRICVRTPPDCVVRPALPQRNSVSIF